MAQALMSFFSVSVKETELIKPETQTPYEFKYLSNIDDQAGLRNYIPFIHVYRGSAGERRDAVPVIRRALSRALVHYYPVAGRLRNGEKGKLVVECCAEGVAFREADANFTVGELQMVDGAVKPPFRMLDRLLVDDVWGSAFVTDSPLLRMQVTRLACGGFVLAYTFNHCVCDAFGALQFITAVSDFAGDPTRLTPTHPPLWSRELLSPRSPPHPSFPHPEYDPDPNPNPNSTPPSESDFRRLTQLSVFFTRSEISALKSQINGPKTPTFDAVAACLWRGRTRALALRSETRLLFPIDTRTRHLPLLPAGYYGAAVVFPCAATPAAALASRPISFAAGLISDLKSTACDKEYRVSVLDFIEVNGRRGFCGGEGAFVVSDMSKLRFADVDFGWGPGIYGGPARAGTGAVPGMVTSVVGYTREDGVEGLLALVSLPRGAVDAFEEEVRRELDDSAPSGRRSTL